MSNDDPRNGLEKSVMEAAPATDRLIESLTRELAPVRRLWSPAVHAMLWLVFVGVIGLGLAAIADIPAMLHRLGAMPDMWLAVVGSTLTAVLGAIAVFQLGLPDRNPLWALLPLPGAVLWIVSSGIGCLRAFVLPDTHVASLNEAHNCLVFILSMSVPLSLVMIVMLRRAFTLHPGLTSALAGLTVAAASATLLNFIHPFDAAATDLMVHVLAVTIVIGANRVFGGRLLNR